jgi:hypothetical protein
MNTFTIGATSGTFKSFRVVNMERMLADAAISFRAECGNLRAEKNDRLDEYEVLQEASCLCLDLASMENRYIADYYGPCSGEAHDLHVLLGNCHDRPEYLGGWKDHTTEQT